jgi:hypothetical protein
MAAEERKLGVAVFVVAHTHTRCVRPGLDIAVRVECMARQVGTFLVFLVREMLHRTFFVTLFVSFPCINSL